MFRTLVLLKRGVHREPVHEWKIEIEDDCVRAPIADALQRRESIGDRLDAEPAESQRVGEVVPR